MSRAGTTAVLGGLASAAVALLIVGSVGGGTNALASSRELAPSSRPLVFGTDFGDDWDLVSVSPTAFVIDIHSSWCDTTPITLGTEGPKSIMLVAGEAAILDSAHGCDALPRTVRRTIPLDGPLGSRTLVGCRAGSEPHGTTVNCAVPQHP